jgi:acyloxyacyl hydrolase
MLSTRPLHSLSRYGGTQCAGCSIVVVLIESLAAVHETSVEHEVQRFCSLFPSPLREPCDVFIADFGPIIVRLLEQKETADAVCLAIDLCGPKQGEPSGPACRILNAPSDLHRESRNVAAARQWLRANPRPKARALEARLEREMRRYESPWEWFIKRMEYTFNNHVPFDDFDNDTFSTFQEFRGWSWRGRDCNDLDSRIHPGRNSRGADPTVDWNCNGIFGTNPVSGRSWEDELCAGTPQYGVAYLGDSAGAHFHIPPQYFNASQIQFNTFSNVIQILANEFDWPQMSSGTGFMNSTWMGSPQENPLGIGSYSMYQRFLERNRCMFRDYQNIAVNGARVTSMASNIMRSFSRNQKLDLPVILSYALVGNDVCSGHHTYDTFTKPAEFKAAVLEALDFLDTVLPNGSHVLTAGLADGDVLYTTMHARVHPLGAVFSEITYTRVYDYLNCLEVSPCWGWMNSNATVRNYTTQYAHNLSSIYPEIIKEYGSSGGRWKNFDLYYFPHAFASVLKNWQDQGGELHDLIEPVDGFHPSQIGDTLLAQYTFDQLTKLYPNVLPPINPNNARIKQLFGDQGGYGL